MNERLRWKLWSPLIRLSRACPATAHAAIVLAYPKRDHNVCTGRAYRRDRAACGPCCCGKLRQDPAHGVREAGDE